MSENIKRTWACVDLDALVKNYETALRLAGGARVCPVVKADAYGHGAVAVARQLSQAGAGIFAVATLDEALALRRAGIGGDILVLGVTAPEGFGYLISEGIIQTVPSVGYAQLLSQYAGVARRRARVHIKLDTGMGRIGLDARTEDALDRCAEDAAAIASLPLLSAEGIFTHFATSDIPDDPFCAAQSARFVRLLDALHGRKISFDVVHAANSGAIINCPDLIFNMVREGIMLYGCPPDAACPDVGLVPVMELKTTVCALSHIRKGESISYGRTFVADRDMPVAVLGVGYADGYPRSLSSRGQVWLDGRLCPVVGRVCMDQMMVDVSDVPEVKFGDTATLFGGASPVGADMLASLAGTISYELLCGVSPRVPRVYTRSGVGCE